MARTLKSRRNAHHKRLGHKVRRGGGFLNRLKGLFTRKKPQQVAPRQQYIDMNLPTNIQPTQTVAPTAKPKFTLKSLFTRKNKTAPVPTLPSLAAATQAPQSRVRSLVSRPATPFTPSSLAPIRAPRIRPSNVSNYVSPSPLVGEKLYESTLEGQYKDLAFAYQKLQGQVPDIRNRTVTDAEWSQLRLRLLIVLYSQPDFARTGDYDIDAVCLELFGISTDEFDKEIGAFERQRFDPQVEPFVSAGSFGRLIPQILRTPRELQRFATIEGCDLGDVPIGKSLKTPFCIYVVNNYDHYLIQSEGRDYRQDAFIILHPEFFSSFNHLARYYNTLSSETTSTQFLSLPAIFDAFTHRGLAIIAPKLGYLLQKDAPELWNKQYYLPKFNPMRPNYTEYTSHRYILNEYLGNSRINPVPEENVDFIRTADRLRDAVRIAVLTLQKYAAIRRWMWTRNPNICSKVYELKYTDLAAELFRLDVDFPDRGYTFDRTAFEREFRDNQIWATGNAYFRSFDDPRLKAFLGIDERELRDTRYVWMTPQYYSAQMHMPIEPLPEDQTARGLVASITRMRPLPYTEANVTREMIQNLTTRAGRAAALGRGRGRSPAAGTGRFSYRHARRRTRRRTN